MRHSAIGVALQQPGLEPQLIDHNFEPLSEESSSTLCCKLVTFGWVALGGLPTASHQNPGAIAATQAQRNRTSIFEDIISCPLLADRKLRIHRFA